jgi:hypothetical protein
VVESLPEDIELLGADARVPRLDSGQWLDYENALAKLPELKREAVLLRLEPADRVEAGALLARRDIVLG